MIENIKKGIKKSPVQQHKRLLGGLQLLFEYILHYYTTITLSNYLIYIKVMLNHFDSIINLFQYNYILKVLI